MKYKNSFVSVMRTIGLNFMMVSLVLVLVLVGLCSAPALM